MQGCDMSDAQDNELAEVVQLLLERPGLEAWARVCMTLLALTDGIERFMDSEDEHPRRDLKNRVQRALATGDERQLQEIADLEVFEYRAISEETLELWNPLAESLLAFETRHAGGIRVWRADSADPERAVVVDWLMNQVRASGRC